MCAAGIFGDVGIDGAPGQQQNHQVLARRESLLVAAQRLYSHPLAVRLAVVTYAHTCTLLLYHCYLVVLSPAGVCVCVCVFTALLKSFTPAQLVGTPCLPQLYPHPCSHINQSIITLRLTFIFPTGALLQAQSVVAIILQAGITNSQASCCGVPFGPCRACNGRCFHKDI